MIEPQPVHASAGEQLCLNEPLVIFEFGINTVILRLPLDAGGLGVAGKHEHYSNNSGVNSMVSDVDDTPKSAVVPSGLNHLVLNVRDLEESHRFWTEIVGFKMVGELGPTERRPNPPKMRFYSGDHAGRDNHHDLALVENSDLPSPPEEWQMFGMPSAINHIAITLPDRESWLRQLKFLQSKGVKFDRRVDHGMTHSLYIHDPNGYGVELLYELPREVWEGDINAALNWVRELPVEGEEALTDETRDNPVF